VQSRRLGKTGRDVSEIGFGAWAIGGSWGETNDDESLEAMNAAVDAGVTFFDTADVYGDGRSEKLIAQLLRDRSESLMVATKFGRRAAQQDVGEFTYDHLRGWLERSRENLGVDVVHLVQLHCPPWDAYYTPSIFESCERLVDEGLVRNYGVSVEKIEEGLKAIEYPSVATVQIIFNIFRQRPAELFFEQARLRDVGLIIRVPLASGLLTGKFSKDTSFAADDHRSFNRHGEQFDVGETFSGLDYATGVEAADDLKGLVPAGASLTQMALRWILDHESVSTVIAGARTSDQVRDNAAASELPPLTDTAHAAIERLYRERIAPQVHQRW
jgi:aryl-alcohol dehydrogenase-like predicted oxidoreductase